MPGPDTHIDMGPSSQTIRKRSVTIAGHRTSISLEEAFWAALRRIAVSKERSISELVTQIDRERTGNLSSAIRIFVLAEVAAGCDAGASQSQAVSRSSP